MPESDAQLTRIANALEVIARELVRRRTTTADDLAAAVHSAIGAHPDGVDTTTLSTVLHRRRGTIALAAKQLESAGSIRSTTLSAGAGRPRRIYMPVLDGPANHDNDQA